MTFYFRAIETFKDVLYLDPGFLRSNEVHLRLAVMFKLLEDYESSYKHFQLVLADSSPCSLSRSEISFHIAHLLEVQGKHKAAKEEYEQLLEQKDLSEVLRAQITKQLGWMYHTVDALTQRRDLSLHYLQKSIESDPTNGQSLYFLGRIYASLGKIHDAFVSYRSSVDKAEGNSDTWCSIGVLYQKQNQPMDALQAYICSVQLDKAHSPAWTNLGLLYENCNQPLDALKCYVNADAGKGPVNPTLSSRVKVLQNQAANPTTPPSSNQRQHKLPPIEDAWNFPISQEMASRQNAAAQGQMNRINPATHNQRQSVSGVQTPVVPGQGSANPLASEKTMQVRPSLIGQAGQDQPPNKKIKIAPGNQQTTGPDANVRPSLYMNQQQLQLLSYFQQNQANLSPQQRSVFQQLQQQYQQMQQHQQKLLMQNQLPAGQASVTVPASTQSLNTVTASQVRPPAMTVENKISVTSNVTTSGQLRTTTHLPAPQTSHVTTTTTSQIQTKPSETSTTEAPQPPNVRQNTHINMSNFAHQPTVVLEDLCNAISDKDLQILLSQKNIASSLLDDLILQQCSNESTLSKKKRLETNSQKTQDSDSKNSSDFSALKKRTFTKPHVLNSYDNETEDKKDDKESFKFKNEYSSAEPGVKSLHPTSLSINMNASEVLTSCKGLGSNGVPNYSVYAELCRPPVPPDPPYPPEKNLLPPTPSVMIDNKKDAFCPQLQEFCLSNPIAVIRGLTNVLKLDLGLFSTKTLVEANPDHTIEVRTQLFQQSDENWDVERKKQVWRCESHRSHTTIARYAQYQASSFEESLREEQEKSTAATIPRESDSDSNSSCRNKKTKGKNGSFKTIKFGTNVDLSNESKWRPQLQELAKLPPFLRVVSAGNMLSHLGHTVLGVNSIQLYMKVPGSRTPAHQENNNFSSVNLNVGPNDCIWFGIAEEYWGVLHQMCERNNLNFLHGSWWPILQELFDQNIPVYRFHQKPGDIVFVGAGTIHWVQAEGWCNNIAYNVGELSARQYQLAVERYEWNKKQAYKSIVPMAHLTLCLARNVKLSDRKLFEQIKYCLLRTLRQSQIYLEFLNHLNKEVRYHGRSPKEPAHYCTVCEVEVFNILCVKEVGKKHLVHCLDCGRKSSPTLENFIILEEYKIEDLKEIYDNFILYPVPNAIAPV
ncbi:hypothetical protein JTE90_018130 [Oedothorax gibbosus]|uniref:[histone H3]-trimethyl-L-lysine(27) demethylase n=1 Tax=Oedothorax gibbosus TaxID=931172 RepID=A0AAV6V0H4_9ARAC|nr:hypothetical protein JTE90_018130 [Oedothorax gibbosus]